MDEPAEHDMALLQDMITAARKIRADNGVDKKCSWRVCCIAATARGKLSSR